MTTTISTPIATAARDLLPETWEALAEATSFGPEALKRLHDRTVRRVFGELLDDATQQTLADIVIEYVGMRVAIKLLDPAIDFWSKQVLSHTAGERESRSYKDRVEDLKELKKLWTTELADLWLDVQDLIPALPTRAVDAPRVINAGDTVAHKTPNPFDMPDIFGPAEEIGGGTAA